MPKINEVPEIKNLRRWKKGWRCDVNDTTISTGPNGRYLYTVNGNEKAAKLIKGSERVVTTSNRKEVFYFFKILFVIAGTVIILALLL